MPTGTVFLKLCWAALVICLACSVFYLDFNIKYRHYARSREYAQRLIDLDQVQLEELDSFPTVVDTAGNVIPKDVQAASFKDSISTLTKDRDWAKNREDRYGKLYSACGYTARYGFAIGIMLLLFFAMKNI